MKDSSSEQVSDNHLEPPESSKDGGDDGVEPSDAGSRGDGAAGSRWRPVAQALLAVALAFVVGAGFAEFVGGLDVDDVAVEMLLQYLLLHGLGFVGVSLVYLRFRGVDLAYLGARVPGLGDVFWGATATAATLVVAYGLLELYSLLGVSSAAHRIEEAAAANPEVYLVLLVLSVVLIGPAEELLFRGVLQNAFAEVVDAAPAVVLASFVFAVMHVGSLSGSAVEVSVYLFTAFSLALVLGAAYEVSGSLLVPAAAHGLYNAVVFYSAYVSAVT